MSENGYENKSEGAGKPDSSRASHRGGATSPREFFKFLRGAAGEIFDFAGAFQDEEARLQKRERT